MSPLEAIVITAACNILVQLVAQEYGQRKKARLDEIKDKATHSKHIDAHVLVASMSLDHMADRIDIVHTEVIRVRDDISNLPCRNGGGCVAVLESSDHAV